jgi:O-antigen/teichoic acid export membrane protein
MVAGYFSFFDLGLGRALTKLAAEHLGRGSVSEVPALVWTAIAMMLGLGGVGTALAWALAPWIASGALTVSPSLQPETIAAFRWLAFSIPVVIVTTAFRGVLEAYQRFGWVNALRIPLGVFNFLGPVAALGATSRIDLIVAVLVIGRAGFAVMHYVVCMKIVPEAMRPWRVERFLVRPLLGFGGWMTVSNVVSPILAYADRFLIGSLLSMSAVAFYVTPFEMVTKLGLLPSALVAVLFPAFSATLATDPRGAVVLLDRALRFVLVALFPAVLVVIVLARPGLGAWLSPDFAKNSTRVLQFLSAGVLLNGMAQVPFAFIQGAGRPDLTAKLHFAELPVFLLLLWWGVSRFGIEGAAFVWMARVGVDAALLYWMTRLVAGSRAPWRPMILALGAGGVLMIVGALVEGTWGRLAFLTMALPVSMAGAWQFLLGASEREAVRATVLAVTLRRRA